MAWKRKPKPGENETAVRVLKALGVDEMNAYLSAVRAGGPAPFKYAAFAEPSFVYLAFFGESGAAQYLKIGIAADVSIRLRSYRTNCPVPRVRVLATEMPTRGDAADLEARLLSHMGPCRLHGEWVKVDGIEAAVDSLTRAASEHCGRPIEFAVR